MAKISEYESLDEEVKELLQNYKFKKPTKYEPCTLRNIKECLIGLHEEMGLHNISYIFNPHLDIENEILRLESLVHLINCVYTLLNYHKDAKEKLDYLKEQNHVLDHNNKQLNAIVSNLKEKVNSEKNEAKACVATAQRISDRSDSVLSALAEVRTKLTQTTKQKENTEKSLKNEISRLRMENMKLLDKLRLKSGTYISCAEACDSTLVQVKEREKKQRLIIAKLQANNQDLIREVLALKEEIVLSGLSDCKIKK